MFNRLVKKITGVLHMLQTDKTPMTVEKAAEYTGFTKSYLYKLIHSGKIPSYKPDTSKQGKVILCKEELQTFMFSNRRASNAELQELAADTLNGGKRL